MKCSKTGRVSLASPSSSVSPEDRSRAQFEPNFAAMLSAITTLIDERIAHALTRKEASPYSTANLPPGVDSCAFHARCRDLAAAGDGRAWKLTPTSRGWFCRREVFDGRTPMSTPSTAANDATGYVEWSVDAALGATTRRSR